MYRLDARWKATQATSDGSRDGTRFSRSPLWGISVCGAAPQLRRLAVAPEVSAQAIPAALLKRAVALEALVPERIQRAANGAAGMAEEALPEHDVGPLPLNTCQHAEAHRGRENQVHETKQGRVPGSGPRRRLTRHSHRGHLGQRTRVGHGIMRRRTLPPQRRPSEEQQETSREHGNTSLVAILVGWPRSINAARF